MVPNRNLVVLDLLAVDWKSPRWFLAGLPKVWLLLFRLIWLTPPGWRRFVFLSLPLWMSWTVQELAGRWQSFVSRLFVGKILAGHFESAVAIWIAVDPAEVPFALEFRGAAIAV